MFAESNTGARPQILAAVFFNASPSEATQEGKKNMKAAIALGAAALLASSTTSAADMKVAADVGYSPHVMASASGGVEGYNVDIMDEIAKRMGVQTRSHRPGVVGHLRGLGRGKIRSHHRANDGYQRTLRENAFR